MAFRLQAELARRKREQADRFARLARESAARFAELQDWAEPASIAPAWARFAELLERDLLPNPAFGFLAHPVLLETMEVRGHRRLARTMRWLEGRLSPSELAALLEEDYAGNPALACRRYRCSHTLAQHLHHFERFSAATGCDWRHVSHVVELGGGYGSMARFLRRNADVPPTHVIIDVPVAALVQWLFLSSVFGPEHVELITAPRDPEPGRISIVPTGLAPRIDLDCELFLSTWGLSEITATAQRRIAAEGWFGAERLLIAFQHTSRDFPDAGVTEEIARAAGCRVEPIRVAGGSSYGFL